MCGVSPLSGGRLFGVFFTLTIFRGSAPGGAVRTEMFSVARDFVKPFHAGVPAHAAVVHAGRASVRSRAIYSPRGLYEKRPSNFDGLFFGGEYQGRTGDLLHAMQAL